MNFVASEAGFKNGIGGASTAKNAETTHYVLFGIQHDTQHPENSGVYFEYDDQRNGGVNLVQAIAIIENVIIFRLKCAELIEVQCNVPKSEWEELKLGIYTVFPSECISN